MTSRHLSKPVPWLLAGTLAATASLAPVAAHAETEEPTETLAVDFSATTGEFRGGATGTLYGLGDDGAPTQALINGAAITNVSQKAPHGTQHPSGDSLQVEEGFFDKHGEEMYIYVQDYYPEWPYNNGTRPGDTRTYNQADGTYSEGSNGVWDYLEVVEFVAEAVATDSAYPENYVFIPFNEPDGGNWYPNWGTQKDQFLADWQAVYEVIHEVWERHGLGEPVIGGPGDAWWHADRSYDFLEYTQANGSLPDVFIWHELGSQNLATFRGHFAEYRAIEAELGIDPLRVNITEWGMRRDMAVPGQIIQWLSIMEDLKIDGQSAYWTYAGNLNDNSALTNSANGGWWITKWYGDLAGSETVEVTPPQLNAVDTLQGIGAIDADNRRATVLFGGTNDDVTLDLSGLSSEVFGESVDIEVREITLSGSEGVHGAPRVIIAEDGVPLEGGELALDVATYDRFAAYQVLITPDQDREVTVDQAWQFAIEAEDTAITGAQVYYQNPATEWSFLASGAYDVGSFNNAGSKLEWTAEIPRDGSYRFQAIGGANMAPGRHALFVDGELAGIVQYHADLGWTYRGSAELTLDLVAGAHTFALRATSNLVNALPGSDITLDKLLLTEITGGEATSYPATTWRFFGGSGLSFEDDATAGFASLAGAEQRVDLYVQTWETGYHDVVLDYATEGASAIEITVNGRVAATVAADSAGAWRSSATVNLNQGINEIELRSVDGALIEALTTVRNSEADVAAVVVEAEDAILHGTAVVDTHAESTGSNASGMQSVGYLGDGAGNALEIERSPGFDTPGVYDVTVWYANAETIGQHDYNPQVVDRQLVVTETGEGEAGEAHFRYTYSWRSFLERTIQVTLTSSNGSLVLGNEAAHAPNVDKVRIAPLTTGEATTVSTVPALILTDIATNPFKAEIEWLAATGVTTGWSTGEGTAVFRPLQNVNRDQMAAFLYRMAGKPEFTAPSTATFTDVPTTHVFFKEIEWLATQGITNGWTVNGVKQFRPATAVNRDVMAAFLYRFAGEPEFEGTTQTFVDVPASHVFYDEIEWLATTGITNGWTVGSVKEFRPTTAVKRDVMAAFLYRYAAL